MTQTTSPHSRRALLLKTATVAAAAVPLGILPSALAADDQLLRPAQPATPRPDPWRGLKVGVASYSLRGLKLDAAIEAIRRVGLKYVSIKDIHLPLASTPDERKSATQKFRDAGITPLSCGVVTMENDEANVRRAFEYARDVGVGVIVCNPHPDSMPLLDRMVKQFDIRLAIHNHGPEDKRFPSPYDALKAAEKFDSRIGLCIDVGHTIRTGVDPAEAIRKCRERLYDLHLKDVFNVEQRGSEVEVGRGVIDIPGILRALLDTGYAYHVGIEHEKDARDPVPGLAESVGYTKGVLTTLGETGK